MLTVGSRLETGGGEPEWTALRDRWERSHVARTGLVSVSLVALLIALA